MDPQPIACSEGDALCASDQKAPAVKIQEHSGSSMGEKDVHEDTLAPYGRTH